MSARIHHHLPCRCSVPLILLIILPVAVAVFFVRLHAPRGCR